MYVNAIRGYFTITSIISWITPARSGTPTHSTISQISRNR